MLFIIQIINYLNYFLYIIFRGLVLIIHRRQRPFYASLYYDNK